MLRRLRRWFGDNDGMTHIASGHSAPNFSLKSLDGRELGLAEALGRGPVVLSFFKVSCPVCQFTYPFLERLFRRYGREAAFLAVSQDDRAASEEFAKKYGVSFPVLPDTRDYPVSNAYGLSMVPTVFLVEPAGKVQVASMGFVKADLEAIADALADRQRQARSALFLASDSVPALKPG